MTRYFMKFTPLFAAEVQMMTPPRHQPRGSGRIRSSFRYSADDVRCKDCTRYDSGHPCHLNECVCLEERIEAGVVELNALARECFGGRMFRPLQRRLRDELNRQPFRFFLGDAHRERWTHWKNRCYGMSERNAAALFLLTADEELWQRVLWHFDSSGFDFSAIRLSGIHPELYSIYQAAKTISVGGDNIVICQGTRSSALFSHPPPLSIQATTRCPCVRPQKSGTAPTLMVGQNSCANRSCAIWQRPTQSGRL